MTRIVQIVPTIRPGSGVAGVAFNLEREFAAAGATVERFTLAEAGRRRASTDRRTSIGEEHSRHCRDARGILPEDSWRVDPTQPVVS